MVKDDLRVDVGIFVKKHLSWGGVLVNQWSKMHICEVTVKSMVRVRQGPSLHVSSPLSPSLCFLSISTVLSNKGKKPRKS